MLNLRVNFSLLLLSSLLLIMANPGRAQRSPQKDAQRAASRPIGATPRPRDEQLPRDAERWVQQSLKRMRLEEKLGQMVMVFYYGGFTSTESPEYKDVLDQVERNHIGGLVIRTRGTPLGVERSQVYPAAALANQLQGHAKVPLLVAADFERGSAMRLEEGTSFPHVMAVAATGQVEDAYTMGKITALEARAAGVHWIFAPVADVNSNPANPIINTRSFGEDPQRVAEFAAAFVRGVEENGALSTTKHFPGHGDTQTDSHLELPLVAGDRARLDAVELLPFRACIEAGTTSVMTGHLAVPALEPDTSVPATLSAPVLTDVLRKQLGFDGIIVTDALDMGGVTTRYAPGDVAVRSIMAGVDVLLVPPVTDAAITALKDAVTSGRIPMQRINDSVERILRAKAKVGLHRQRVVDLAALNTSFRRPEFTASAQDITDRGVTLLRDEPRLLPLDATRPRRALLLVAAGDLDPYPGADLENELRWRVDELRIVRTDTRFVKVEHVALPPPDTYDVALIALFVRVADRKGTVGLPPEQAAMVNQLLAGEKPSIVLSFGSPYLVESFPGAKTWLATFSTVDVAQRAAVRALFGQVPIGGKLPVTVPGVAKLGDGLAVPANPMTLREASAEMVQRLGPAFDVVNRAIADRAFPGAVLAVGYKGELAVQAFGKHTYEAKAPDVAADTIYDLASLTKPIVTATAVAMLVEAGRLQLDLPVARYVPEFAAGPQPDWRARVTLQHLLTHSSGLPSHKPYFAEVAPRRTSRPASASGRDSTDEAAKAHLLARIFAEPLETEPGGRAQYSDLGFILLGEVVERVTGQTVAEFATKHIFQPLGMATAQFNPAKDLRARIPPTEMDANFRRRLVHGQVHDENAFVMGGAAGHAGMFGTADDVARFAQMLLNGGIYAHQRLLRRSTVGRFTSRVDVAGTPRALGWVVPTEPSSSGKYFSASGFGHTGYTGTSLWLDPEKELFVILLTNRVHPTRDNTKIDQVRPALHDAVIESLGLVPAALPPAP
ncbi:MAG: glycoside hydrolase family 3 N-terminal domain-containing protein [Candidatus Acidiferrales bacterium]